MKPRHKPEPITPTDVARQIAQAQGVAVRFTFYRTIKQALKCEAAEAESIVSEMIERGELQRAGMAGSVAVYCFVKK